MHALRLKRYYKKGITLLEVMLSLSIISVILVMATRYFNVASDMERINALRADLGGLIVAAEAWHSYHANFGDISINNMYIDRLLPQGSDIQQNGVGQWEMFNPWAQQITIVPTNLNAGVNNAYTVTTTMPNNTDCERFRTIYPDMATSGYGTECNNGVFTLVGPIG